MLAKLIAIVLTAGLIALTLLVIRQQRIDAVHDMARSHERLLEHERRLWSLRRELAAITTPETVRGLMESLEVDWRPIPAEPGAMPEVPRIADAEPVPPDHATDWGG